MEVYCTLPTKYCDKCPKFQPHMYHTRLENMKGECLHDVSVRCDHEDMCRDVIRYIERMRRDEDGESE